jgi:hypothetical protein
VQHKVSQNVMGAFEHFQSSLLLWQECWPESNIFLATFDEGLLDLYASFFKVTMFVNYHATMKLLHDYNP